MEQNKEWNGKNQQVSGTNEAGQMQYEIVELKEKTIAGVCARTNNLSPEMGMVIGGLWKQFYEEGVYAGIEEKVNEKALGIYTEYGSDNKNEYTAMVACEIKAGADNGSNKNPAVAIKKIPAGKYARFTVKGDAVKAVAAFWGKLWQMDLDRNYRTDFEEYQNGDMENALIYIFVGLNN